MNKREPVTNILNPQNTGKVVQNPYIFQAL